MLSDNIANGSVIVRTPEAFLQVLRQFPDNPDLLFMYARLLLESGSEQSAFAIFENARDLLLSAGRLVKAIAAQAIMLHLRPVATPDVCRFLDALDTSKADPLPGNLFLKSLAIDEKLDFLRHLHILSLPPQTVVKKIGDPEQSLYFVASGELKESVYQLIANNDTSYHSPDKVLKEGDRFGNIYPYTEEVRSKSIVESITQVALAVLPKNDAIQLCKKYPRFENNIITLCNIRSSKRSISNGSRTRKSLRYPVRVNTHVQVLTEKGDEPEFDLTGCSKDISLSGVGVIVNQCSKKIIQQLGFLLENDQRRKTKSIFSDTHMSLTVSGELVRFQEIIENGRKTVMLGIQFDDIAPNQRGLLFSMLRLFSHSTDNETTGF
jgi:CRP-like cAMP-binding protein